MDILGVDCSATGMLDEWKAMAYHLDTLTEEVHIAMVGKYTDLSVLICPSSRACSMPPWPSTENSSLTGLKPATSKTDGVRKNTNPRSSLREADGILVPGGLATEGLKEKSRRHYARTEGVPYRYLPWLANCDH